MKIAAKWRGCIVGALVHHISQTALHHHHHRHRRHHRHHRHHHHHHHASFAKCNLNFHSAVLFGTKILKGSFSSCHSQLCREAATRGVIRSERVVSGDKPCCHTRYRWSLTCVRWNDHCTSFKFDSYNLTTAGS